MYVFCTVHATAKISERAIMSNLGNSATSASEGLRGEVESLTQALRPEKFSGLSTAHRDTMLRKGLKLLESSGRQASLILIEQGGLTSILTILLKMSRKMPVSTLALLSKVLCAILGSVQDLNVPLNIPSKLSATLAKLIQECQAKLKKQRQRGAREEWALVLQYWLRSSCFLLEVKDLEAPHFTELHFAREVLFPLLLHSEHPQVQRESTNLASRVLHEDQLNKAFLTLRDGAYLEDWLVQLERTDAPDNWQFYEALCVGLSQMSFADVALVSDVTFRLGATILQELSNLKLILFEKEKQLQDNIEIGEKCFLALLQTFCAFCESNACAESITSVPLTVDTINSVHPESVEDFSEFEQALSKYSSGIDQIWNYLYGLRNNLADEAKVASVFAAMSNLMRLGSYTPPCESLHVVDLWLEQSVSYDNQLHCIRCIRSIVEACAGRILLPQELLQNIMQTIFGKLKAIEDEDSSAFVQEFLESAFLIAESNPAIGLVETSFIPLLCQLLLASLDKRGLMMCNLCSRVVLKFCTVQYLHTMQQFIPLGLFTLFDAAFTSFCNEAPITPELVWWHKDVLEIIIALSRAQTKQQLDESVKREINRSLANHRPVLKIILLRVGSVYEEFTSSHGDPGFVELCWQNSLKAFVAADALPNAQVGETELYARSLRSIAKVLQADLQTTESECQSLVNLLLRVLETCGSALKSEGELETIQAVEFCGASVINSRPVQTVIGKVIVSKSAEVIVLCSHIGGSSLGFDVACSVVKSLDDALNKELPPISVSEHSFSAGKHSNLSDVFVFHVLVCIHILVKEYFSKEVIQQLSGSVLRAIILFFKAEGTFLDHQETEWNTTSASEIGMNAFSQVCKFEASSPRNVFSQLFGLYDSFERQCTRNPLSSQVKPKRY